MIIDIEWDKAPEDATHACINPMGGWTWMKANLLGSFNHYWSQRFSEWKLRSSLAGEITIPRPAKQEGAEWNGEGLPSVGCECERRIGSDIYHVTVVGYHDGEVVVFQHDASPEYTGVQHGYLRPIRTKEQLDRDHLIKVLNESSMSHAEDMADAILEDFDIARKGAE